MQKDVRRFLQLIFNGSTVNVRTISTTGNLSSQKWRQKIQDKRNAANLPPLFQAKLKEWPRLLQKEIDTSNERIHELLNGCDRDWTDLEERGLAIGSLKVATDTLDPIDGRKITLSRQKLTRRLVGKGFKPGSPVVLCNPENFSVLAEGIYLSRDKNEITVKVLKSRKLETGTEIFIRPSVTSGALHTLRDLLKESASMAKSPGTNLLRIAFMDKPMPSIHNDRIPSNISSSLNESQMRAVAAALNRKRPFVCIQGPPGTGKTHVIAEIVRLLTRSNQKVLVCAPSNVAVDNVLQKATQINQGDHNESYDDSIWADAAFSTLESAMEAHPEYLDLVQLCSDVSEGDLDSFKKAKAMKFKILKDSYKKHRVIFTTVFSSVIQKLAYVDWFPDVIIIDEAAQCMEPSAWAAILRAPRCILVGDHEQLPCVVQSADAFKGELNVSLMERLVKIFASSNLMFRLSTQYRMNETIMKWSSEKFYNGELVAADEVKNIRLSDISSLWPTHDFDVPLAIINTDKHSKEINVQEEKFRASFRNHGEAQLVLEYLKFLEQAGVSSRRIGVITPYYAQVQLLKSMISDENISVNSVDGFQGQEKDVIIFSMVRQNEHRSVGFLHERRRMNVAVTRAKRQCLLIGSVRMMKTSRTLNSLYKAIERHGKIYSLAHLLEDNVSMKKSVKNSQM